jgi:hypothetical protein
VLHSVTLLDAEQSRGIAPSLFHRRQNIFPDQVDLRLHVLDVGSGHNDRILVGEDDDELSVGAVGGGLLALQKVWFLTGGRRPKQSFSIFTSC